MKYKSVVEIKEKTNIGIGNELNFFYLNVCPQLGKACKREDFKCEYLGQNNKCNHPNFPKTNEDK